MDARPFLLALAALAAPLAAQTAVLPAVKDATLYQRINGQWANGAGDFLHAGRTNTNGRRRAMLTFDPASVLPAGSTVLGATLVLECNRAPMVVIPTVQSLHVLRVDWGEGPSNPAGPEGVGAQSGPGDSTWFHAELPNKLWTNPGGDFDQNPSASTTIVDEATYTWSGAGMASDVQHWLDNPGDNYGWILRSDTESQRSARRYLSRQNPNAALHPRLVLNFEGPAIGQVDCPAVLNSTGSIGRLRATGSLDSSANLVRLSASDLPAGQPTILVTGRLQIQLPFAGGGQGTLCVDGDLGRYPVQASNPSGAAVRDLDLTSIPTSDGPASALPGETWRFQLWYRDSNPALTSNFTEAVELTFQ